MNNNQYRLLWNSISTSKKIKQVAGDRWFRLGCHLVYTWLLPWGDDDGRLRGEPLWVLANIVPNEGLSITEIEKILKELDRIELIAWYEISDEGFFIQINDWGYHQKIRKDRYKPSIYPCQPNVNQMSTKCQPNGNPSLLVTGDGDGNGDDNKKGGAGGKKNEIFILPDWIPQETWSAYLEVRKKKKAASTPYAFKLVIEELLKIQKEHNQDPVDVLNKSIKSGWSDVYPIKENKTQSNYKDNITNHNMGVLQRALQRKGAI